MPTAITAHARAVSRSTQVVVGMGWPVAGSVPKPAQHPSSLPVSSGMEPSTTRMKGSSLPAAASSKPARNSSPTS